jgi:uncharacterized protein with PIN domain
MEHCKECEAEMQFIGNSIAAPIPTEKWVCPKCKVLYLFITDGDDE